MGLGSMRRHAHRVVAQPYCHHLRSNTSCRTKCTYTRLFSEKCSVCCMLEANTSHNPNVTTYAPIHPNVLTCIGVPLYLVHLHQAFYTVHILTLARDTYLCTFLTWHSCSETCHPSLNNPPFATLLRPAGHFSLSLFIFYFHFSLYIDQPSSAVCGSRETQLLHY